MAVDIERLATAVFQIMPPHEVQLRGVGIGGFPSFQRFIRKAEIVVPQFVQHCGTGIESVQVPMQSDIELSLFQDGPSRRTGFRVG